MKPKFIILLLFLCIGLNSCIKEEALNAEADILTANVPKEILKMNPVIENTRITFRVKFDTDLTNQAPLFTLTEGATIQPESGTIRDFTKPQIYTVTSQDGKWKKNYTITFIIAELSTHYDFENIKEVHYDDDPEEDVAYYNFYEKDEGGNNIMEWASGNAGYQLTGVTEDPFEYPTTYTEEGKSGKALKLVTKNTGYFGNMFKKPIAAGNLFMGNFDFGAALTSPLKSAQMGVPFEKNPMELRGYFKYKAGETYKAFEDEDQNNYVEIEGKKDSWDIYAIFYDNDNGELILDGTNKFTHENLVSIARIDQNLAIETEEWTYFEIPFELVNGKTIDREKLENNGYNISVVITSSINGDEFSGAEESTLLIDELEIIYE